MRPPLRSRPALMTVAAAAVPFALHLLGAHPAAASTRPGATVPKVAAQSGATPPPGAGASVPTTGASATGATSGATSGAAGAAAPGTPARRPRHRVPNGRHQGLRHRAPGTSGTASTGAPTSGPRPTPTAATGSGTTAGTGAPRRPARPSGLALSVRHDGKLVAALAHAAADPAASIVDFSFSPQTITIHVGDTVTWTNSGQQPHSATADDHSFDTGILRHGQSGSHTFTKAGTFSYFCIVHPYMKGTIVVQAAATTPSSSTTPTTSSNPSTSTTPTTPPATTPTPSGPSLPMTGVDLGGLLLLGGGLCTGGFVLRRRFSGE